MKLLTIKVGATLILALYATACSQPNRQPVNSRANNLPAAANTTPTPTTHEPWYGLEEVLALHRQQRRHKDLPTGWTSGEIVEKGNLGNHIERDYCLESKKASYSNPRSIIVSVYLDVQGIITTVVAANSLPEAQADAEELKGAERVAKNPPQLREIPHQALRRPQKWHGHIEVKVRSLCFPTDMR